MLLRRPMSVILFLSFCGAAVAEEVPREKIEETIAVGVETILATQNDAGGFVLEPRRFGVYPLGCTGISVLALQHALPHLKGELRTQAAEGIRKGIAFIAQRPPEQKTYSAGFILCALYKESPQRYHKLIGKYAEMLVVSQWREKTDRYYGEWGYNLHPPGLRGSQQPPRRLPIWGDRSNDQIAILGLYYAERAGYQIPKAIWRRAREHYLKLQFPDGGWGYKDTLRPQPYANMTIASTISLFICEEMLYAEKHRQFKPPARSEAIEKGLAWIVKHWDESNVGQDVYGAYALERLGIIRGRSNIGTHDWFNEAAAVIVGRRTWRSLIGGNSGSDACFAVLFLARGLEPIVINKLERKSADDWNNNPYDVKHVIEYIVDHYQDPIQWRIVTLDAPAEMLLRVPILFISGHKKLEFTDEEKAKLKAYVMGGGTILGHADGSRRVFDKSFRTLVSELFGDEMEKVPKTHRLYERMRVRGKAPKPTIYVKTLPDQEGRPGVIYLPQDHGFRWHRGGSSAESAFAVGTGIYFYVTIECRKMYERTHPKPATPPKPETPVKPETPTKPDPPANPDDIRFPGNHEPDEKRPG